MSPEFKVVGFKNRKLKGLLIGQNMWITVAGIILGIATGGRYDDHTALLSAACDSYL